MLVQFAYTRDAAGNPTAIGRESGGAFYYEYDALQRLTYDGQSGKYYTYDAAGNRTQMTDAYGYETVDYTYGAGNELTGISVHAPGVERSGGYDWDQNGNAVLYWMSGQSDVSYGWDSRDMLVNYNDAAYYRYDGMAGRVSTQESAGVTYYDWDGINVIQEKDASGSVTERQVHGYAPIPSVGDIALMDKRGHWRLCRSPTRWGRRAVLDPTAAVANTYTYDAFGVGRAIRRLSATSTASGPSGWTTPATSITSSHALTRQSLLVFLRQTLSK